ncbi:unnamed protein product [Thelazia callipaeda]|uniref:TSC22 domain family protein 1 n=1 Tax=Thelazia callipaeda TaxID=103827 RepID=A0A0N5D1K9_THECL|nr:unnamed protein product [Thelazia callipaeda]
MVLMHALSTVPSSCMYFSRITTIKDLDFNLAMLCNYGNSCEASERQFMGGAMHAASTYDVSSENVTTPPATSDLKTVENHRWSASSALSINSVRSTNTQTSLPSSCISQNTSSSTSSTSSREISLETWETCPEITSVLFDLLELTRTATSTSATPNVVPIDNKIEQAMDLVKTHLTFAVREEVEILRSTIVDLEAKVAHLESQNQVLRQFAPVEVVNSLAVLVQQQQQRQAHLQQHNQQICDIPSSSSSQTASFQSLLKRGLYILQNLQNTPASVQNVPKQPTSAVAPEASVPSNSSNVIQVDGSHSEKESVIAAELLHSKQSARIDGSDS